MAYFIFKLAIFSLLISAFVFATTVWINRKK